MAQSRGPLATTLAAARPARVIGSRVPGRAYNPAGMPPRTSGGCDTRGLDDLLASRCVACREVVRPDAEVVNHGDVLFHLVCQPSCATCGRALAPGDGGWRSEGRVVSEPWGYAVRPDHFWCPNCLGSVPRDPPRGGEG